MSVARHETASHQQHKEAAPPSVSCMVITCSDTRTPETDTSGALIKNTLREQGHMIAALLEKRLAGFGEIFRYLSYQDIGSAAIMSRATAGLYKGTIVISIPGSEKAALLAMDKLILNELGHMVREMSK